MGVIFGELLLKGLKTVKEKRNVPLKWIMQEIAEQLEYSVYNIERFCYKGDIPTTLEQVETIIRYCIQQGTVDRQWASRLLNQARYPEPELLLQTLFPTLNESSDTADVNHNLPARSPLVGRLPDLARILEGLDSDWAVVTVEGMPGLGKTVLSIEAAYRCLPTSECEISEPFEAVVWVSARGRTSVQSWFTEVLNRVAEVLNYEYIFELPLERKQVQVNKLLRTYRILIVLDNFSTMVEDRDLVAWLYQLPDPSKALITSRKAQLGNTWRVELQGLAQSDAIILIRTLAKAKNLLNIAAAEEPLLMPLAHVTDGNPAAIDMALGHVKFQSTLDEVVEHLTHGSESVKDIFEYIVVWAWGTLPENARNLLASMPFFAHAVSKDALLAVSDLTVPEFEETLHQLVGRSFLQVEGELTRQERRYTIHPLVRAFVVSQQALPAEWEMAARQRWVSYYLDFVDERMRRPKINEPYWRYLGGGMVMSMRYEWQNVLNVLQWADHHQHQQVLIDLMIRLVHYMDRRAYHPVRLEYARKAAAAAHMLGEFTLEALFRIDALGVTWRKIGRYEEALLEIQMGLMSAQRLAEHSPEQQQLQALGYTFLAKTYAEMGEMDDADQWNKQAMMASARGTPVLRHRILVTDGDINYKNANYHAAKVCYLQAADLIRTVSTTGDTDIAGVQRKLGNCYLALGDLARAEEEFNTVIRYNGQGGVLNEIYAKFGLAQVKQMQGRVERARILAIETKEALSRLSMGHPLLVEIDSFLNSLS